VRSPVGRLSTETTLGTETHRSECEPPTASPIRQHSFCQVLLRELSGDGRLLREPRQRLELNHLPWVRSPLMGMTAVGIGAFCEFQRSSAGFELIGDALGLVLPGLIEVEATEQVGACRYERSEPRCLAFFAALLVLW
jgi:hypothetical protein